MADEVTLKLTGVEAIATSIHQLAIASPMAVQKGVLRVAEKIERQAKANCPVETGRLHASLSTNWTGSGMARGNVDAKAQADDGVGQPVTKADTFLAVVGTNVVYGPRQEFEESYHHTTGGPHYLYAAYFSLESEVPAEISSELGKELARAMKK